MVRPTILALTTAIPILLGAGARAGSEGSWSFDPPFLPHRGRIGVQVEAMTPELRGYFRAPEDRGLLVVRVEPDRPAARAGLRVGDVIVSVGGDPARSPFELIRTVAAAPAGRPIELGVVRGGAERTLSVEPEGEPSLWAEPGRFGSWFEEKLQGGSQELRERIEQLERRLEELERKLEEPDGGTGGAPQKT